VQLSNKNAVESCVTVRFFITTTRLPTRLLLAAIRECGFQLLNHPPYSQDLAPIDYYVLRSLKDSVHGHNFYSNEEVIYVVNDWFEQQDKKFLWTV